MVKIGINGFGRIGRLVLRAALDKGADVSFILLQVLNVTFSRVFKVTFKRKA